MVNLRDVFEELELRKVKLWQLVFTGCPRLGQSTAHCNSIAGTMFRGVARMFLL